MGRRFTWAASAAAALVIGVGLGVLPAAGDDGDPGGPVPSARRGDPLPEDVTFTQHVAPIVFNNCSSCHRPGEAAPFSLLGYDDVRKRGPMVHLVTKRRYMPPWRPAPGYGHFEAARSLTDRQIGLIQRWVEEGMAEGPKDALPELPTFTKGWFLGEPDLVVEMDKGYTVHADGPDIYRNFVIPLGTEEDRWVSAVEVRPTARTAVHHTLFFLDTTGRARRKDAKDPEPGFQGMRFGRGGSLGGWAVGATPQRLPNGLGRRLPAGADLVLQTHFHPTGKEEVEKTRIGIYFTKKQPERTLVDFQGPPGYGRFAGLKIPAGESSFTIRDSLELPTDVRLVASWGHAHYLGKSKRARAILPDGRVEPLLYIPKWDFNWQGIYPYETLVDLPKGTRLEVEVTYDNSAENPFNPSDPPRVVEWGLESTDEMGSVIFAAIPKREEDARLLKQSTKGMEVLRQLGARGLEQVGGQLLQADLDGDGKVTESELPRRARRYFQVIDRNQDQVLTQEDIDAIQQMLEREPVPMGPIYLDLEGNAHEPLTVRSGAPATLCVFVTTDCPIANAYATELNAIKALCDERGVRMVLVEVDPDATIELAKLHRDEYGLVAPIVLDPEHDLATRLGVKATPEAALITPGGNVYYQGAIDNAFSDLGQRRRNVNARYLRDALNALQAGKAAPKVKRTEPVGCLLPVPEKARAEDAAPPEEKAPAQLR
ncbi:MAG: redoxin domain-containing protein [Planctomycetota bacterium]|jgi:hypothetical protein